MNARTTADSATRVQYDKWGKVIKSLDLR